MKEENKIEALRREVEADVHLLRKMKECYKLVEDRCRDKMLQIQNIKSGTE